MFAHGENGIRLRAAVVEDPYSGEPTGRDWDTADTLALSDLAFNPGSSNEPREVGRNAVITQPEVYGPVGIDVLAGDRLEIRGRTYEVEGDVSEWRSPFTGWEAGVVIKLQAVEG